jgi:hypothetical protein
MTATLTVAAGVLFYGSLVCLLIAAVHDIYKHKED